MFKMEVNDPKGFLTMLDEKAKMYGIDTYSLVGTTEMPIFEKYDSYIPSDLLRKSYAEDRLRSDEVCRRLDEIAREE